MTSFTKHRRQPGGKSLVRLKLKVTPLLLRVWADLLQNIHVYFWSLKIALCPNRVAKSLYSGRLKSKVK